MQPDHPPPFERIVRRHGATVLRVCRAVLGPTHESEDAWSETFLAALRAYPGLPPGTNIEAWLVTIAHRKAIDVVRAVSRLPVPTEAVPDAFSTLGIPQDPDPALWEALAALPPKQRQAVAYHHVAGLPYRAVAGILGGSPEAARRAAADGIRSLRRSLSATAPQGALP